MALTLSGTNGVVGAGFTVDASGVSVTAGVGTFSSIGAGASVPAAGLTGSLPTISAASLTSIPAANIVGVCTSGLTKTGGFGKLLQIVGSSSSGNVSFNSTETYADSGLSVNITTSASGHAGVLAMVSASLGGVGNNSGGESAAEIRLMRDSSEIANVTSGSWAGNDSGHQVSNHASNSLVYYDSGTSASTTYTYKIQFRKRSDTVNAQFNNYNGKSYIHLIEVGS